MRKFLLAAMIIGSAACATTQGANQGIGEPKANVASSENNTTYGSTVRERQVDPQRTPRNLNGESPVAP